MTDQTPSQPSEMPAPAGAASSPGEDPAAALGDPATPEAAGEPVAAPQTAAAQAGLAGASATGASAGGASFSPPPSSDPIGTRPAAGTEDRPEVVVGAAFAGGFALAMILKRLAR